MTFPNILKKLSRFLVLFGAGVLLFGVSLSLGTWIYIKSQLQGKVVKVPDLYGMSQEEAMTATSQLGLNLRLDPANDVHSNVIGAGHVLLQIPRPGRKVKEARTVEITLSAGPEKNLIPPLEGQTLHFSEVLLDQAATSATVIARTPSTIDGKGRILAQYPAGGEELGLRSGVSLLVSDGPQEPWFVMPDMVGRDYLDAKRILDRLGFKVTTKYRSEDESKGPIILDQSPLSGYPVNKSQNITLVVNKEF